MRMTTTLSGDFPELQKKLAGLSGINRSALMKDVAAVSYTHLRAHETDS